MSSEKKIFSVEAEQLLSEIYSKFLNSKQDPGQVILDDVDLRNLLKISKRKAAYLRSERKIAFSKDGGKIYYLFSDVLDYLKRSRVDIISNKLLPKN